MYIVYHSDHLQLWNIGKCALSSDTMPKLRTFPLICRGVIFQIIIFFLSFSRMLFFSWKLPSFTAILPYFHSINHHMFLKKTLFYVPPPPRENICPCPCFLGGSSQICFNADSYRYIQTFWHWQSGQEFSVTQYVITGESNFSENFRFRANMREIWMAYLVYFFSTFYQKITISPNSRKKNEISLGYPIFHRVY